MPANGGSAGGCSAIWSATGGVSGTGGVRARPVAGAAGSATGSGCCSCSASAVAMAAAASRSAGEVGCGSAAP